jgi:hypothetical protein
MTLELWIAAILAGFAHAGTILAVILVVTVASLATRCEGCCREDEIFRPHVV